MIVIIMFVIFLAAYCFGGKVGAAVAIIANMFVPDEIPFVDEIIQIAILLH